MVLLNSLLSKLIIGIFRNSHIKMNLVAAENRAKKL